MKKILSTLALLLAIGQGAWAYDKEVSINARALTVTADQHWRITGNGETSNQITIQDGATVTLSNVNIKNSRFCIKCEGNATVILEDGSTNKLTAYTGYTDMYPALIAGGKGTTLTIKGGNSGSGVLNATGSSYHVAIGGGDRNLDQVCGNIKIEGGVINAWGGTYAAGIGSDFDATHSGLSSICGDITITGGVVNAWGGENAAAIGSGRDASCGKVTITGGDVNAWGGENAAAIGSGNNAFCGNVTITSGANSVTATKGDSSPYSIGKGASDAKCGTVTIGSTLDSEGEPVGGRTGFIAQSPFAFVTTSDALLNAVEANYEVVMLGADISIGRYLWIKNGRTITIDLNGYKLTRTGAESDPRNGQVIFIDQSGHLTLKDTGGGTITGGYAINGGGINNWGELTIEGGTITGNKSVVNNNNEEGRGAGIFNEKGATLTITGGAITGNETVGNAHGGAGIFNNGTMTITGGSVTGNTAAPGHGGGIKNYGTLNMKGNPVVKENIGGDVWLGEGEVVTCTGALTGGANSIGIQMERVGVFTTGYSTSGTTTNPFFASKTVNDIVLDGSEQRERIGYYECSWDGTKVVRTVKHVEGDCIYLTGGKNVNLGRDITDSWYIVDGTIDYSMRVWCYNNVHIILCDNAYMSIGHGLKVFHDSPHNATLKIYAQSNDKETMGKLISHCDASGEAGIGSVESTKMGAVEFHGGYIEAEGDDNGAGIGGGKNANGGPITIYDGIILAIRGWHAAAIGGGDGGSGEGITIYGGEVTADASSSTNSAGAGIGGGDNGYRGGGGSGVINIWGGKITAKGGTNAAAIGGGRFGALDEINIHGGIIEAYSEEGGCGIGSGRDTETRGGIIRITGGTVNAYSTFSNNLCGPGIGSFAGGYTIEISGGKVYAEGGRSKNETIKKGGTAGIGGANVENCGGNITITGGEIEACGGGPDAVGIGWWQNSEGTVTISGGKVKARGTRGAIAAYNGSVNIEGCQVWAGPSEEEATQQVPPGQAEACRTNTFARVEACTDHHCNYVNDNTNEYHIGTCTLCGHVETEKHTINTTTGACVVCGYNPTGGIWSVSLFVPMLDEDGYCKYEDGKPVYHGSAFPVFKGQTFYLPVCDAIPKGYVFDCWVANSKSTTLEAEDWVSPLQPGGSYKPVDNVEIRAHFRKLNINLADDADNNATILRYSGLTATSVTLKGRTLYKDGLWNTLCLPFSLSADQIAASELEGADIRTLDEATFNKENKTLTLTFSDAGAVTGIEAGKAYIVKWAATSPSVVESPVFTDVTITNTNPMETSTYTDGSHGSVTFLGTYASMMYDEEMKDILFLGADNNLYYPQPDTSDPDSPRHATIGAFRAYFQLNGFKAGDDSDDDNSVRSFVLNFGDDPTGITTMEATDAKYSGAWFSFDGMRLNAKPTAKGIYIHNGRKFVVK